MMRTSILISLLLMSACNSANIYESARQNRQLECRKLKGAAFDECMKQYEDDYRAYIEKREQVK